MTESFQSRIEKAGALLDDGKFDLCLSTMKSIWLNAPENGEIISLFSRYARALNQNELAVALERLAEKVKIAKTIDENPQEVFEAAYHLVGQRYFDIGRSLLQKCLDKFPANNTVRYELAFAQMSLGQFKEAISNFEQVVKLEEDFDTVLNLSACYALTRDLKNVENTIRRLEKLASDQEEKNEIAHRKMILKRLHFMASKKEFNKQDWFFVLYGTILLGYKASSQANTNVGPQVDAFDVLVPNHNMKAIAGTLAVLKGVLRGLEIEPEAIEYYNTYAKPLAQVEARLFDLTVENYTGPDRPDYALMLMNSADEIVGPHQAFIENCDNRATFAYALNLDVPLPVTPDIVGHLGQIRLPWDNDIKMSDDPEHSNKILAEAMPRILEIASHMENDAEVIGTITDTVLYYNPKLEMLNAQNSQKIPRRPEFTAEIHDY
jgi:tetratricopeptide (TPR) repeat protein